MSVVSRTFFPLHILLWTAERMSDRMAIRSQARQIAANNFKTMRRSDHEAMNRALFVPKREREKERERASKLTCVSARTLSRIKAEPEKEVFASKKLRSYNTELGDFDKCVVRRTVSEMYGSKKIRPTLDRISTRYNSCNQPCVIFGAGTRIVQEQTRCQPLWYWVGQWGGYGNSKRMSYLAKLECFYKL